MLKFLSATPKRTKCWSSSPSIAALNLGPITKQAIKACTVKSTDVYVDKRGKKRYKGNKNLKSTQSLRHG